MDQHHPPTTSSTGGRRRRLGGLLAAAALGSVLAVAAPAGASVTTAPVTSRVSVSNAGGQIPGTSKVDENPKLDGSGRFVFFTTSAPLQSDDVNGTWDVYVRDRVAGTTTRVSSKPDGTPFSASTSILCGVSTDGRYVGFFSPPSGSTDVNRDQVWILERKTGIAEVVSVSSSEQASGDGTASGIAPVGDCSISSNGRYVAFVSTASNLVAGDAGGFSDVFRRDRTNGTTIRVSISSGGTAGNGPSRFATMSDDGATIAYQSDADNLIPNDTNGHTDVFARFIGSNTTVKASLTDNDGQVFGGDSTDAHVSGNGHQVVFASKGAVQAVDATGATPDIYLRDLDANSTELVSVATNEDQGDGYNGSPNISDDGRFVTFSSTAKNLYPAKVTNTADVFRRDRQLGKTDLVSRTAGISPGNGASFFGGAPSNDGDTIAFPSEATDLVRHDTNGKLDVFVRDFSTDMAPFSSFDELTKQQFADFAGRQPTAAELTEWHARLVNGEYSPDGLIDVLAHSTAWSGKRAPLIRLYWAFFLRTPDLNGLDYWVGKLTSGTSLSSVAAQFAKSSEFQTKYGSKTNEQFVTLIYQNIFNRDPDPSGLAYWTGKLDAKTKTRGDVMVNFSESSEGKRVLAPQTDTVLIWLGMMRTMPPKSTFETVSFGMKNGIPPEAFAAAIREKSEYWARL